MLLGAQDPHGLSRLGGTPTAALSSLSSVVAVPQTRVSQVPALVTIEDTGRLGQNKGPDVTLTVDDNTQTHVPCGGMVAGA